MRGHDLFRTTAIVAALLCYVTILVGGTVMASDSGLGCSNWPACYPNGSLLPVVHGAAQIEWSHRVVAFFLAINVLVLAALALVYERGRRVLQRASFAALALVVAEAALGGWVVRSDLVIALVLVHLALATALFGILLLLVFLSNLKQMPKRWVDWARRAADGAPAPELAGELPPSPEPAPGRPHQS